MTEAARLLRLLSIAGAYCCLLLASPALADVTGHWRGASGPTYGIEESAGVVTLSDDGPYQFEGTLSGGAMVLTAASWPHPYPAPYYTLSVTPDETIIGGTYREYACVLSLCGWSNASVSMSRCGCYDGNLVSGDGCDIECRVEACHACSGDPSTCAPLADGTACEHPSDCVSGGSCSGGRCSGGDVDNDCTDLSGGWLRTQSWFEHYLTRSFVSQFVQEAATARIYNDGSTSVDEMAAVDASLGWAFFGTATGFPYCNGQIYDDAIVAEDATSFALSGQEIGYGGPGRCLGWDHFQEVGVRCADPTLEPSDGCRADSCTQCSGDPEVCEPVPDGTACVSSDPCTVLATCNGGECVASIADECGPCAACDGAGGCRSGPRDNCRAPVDPRKSTLAITRTDDAAESALRWSWKKGGSIGLHDLGRPELDSEVTVCLYDESTPTPSLIFHARVGDELDLDDDPEGGATLGWSRTEDGSARFKDSTGLEDGVTSIQLSTGQTGKASIKLKALGEALAAVNLPAPELPLPLRAQVEIEGGACFEATYGPEGVSRNADGKFRAKGTP